MSQLDSNNYNFTNISSGISCIIYWIKGPSFICPAATPLCKCVCVWCCWQHGLYKYDKWPNFWDYSDRWQSPVKLTSTKLDGMLFLRFLFDSCTLVLAQCFSKQDILFSILIISFFQTLPPHQQVHVLLLLQDTLIITKLERTWKNICTEWFVFFLFPRKFITWGFPQVWNTARHNGKKRLLWNHLNPHM